MQVPSTVLQRIVRDYHTISREMEKKREEERGKEREGEKVREEERETQTHHQGAVSLYYY